MASAPTPAAALVNQGALAPGHSTEREPAASRGVSRLLLVTISRREKRERAATGDDDAMRTHAATTSGGPRKRAWTPSEDEQLRSVVMAGPIKWSAVAELIGTRNAKQCRERWHYQLNPEIKKGRWTAEEDALISALPHGEWARVAKALPGRTDMAIKNR